MRAERLSGGYQSRRTIPADETARATAPTSILHSPHFLTIDLNTCCTAQSCVLPLWRGFRVSHQHSSEVSRKGFREDGSLDARFTATSPNQYWAVRDRLLPA